MDLEEQKQAPPFPGRWAGMMRSGDTAMTRFMLSTQNTDKRLFFQAY